MCVFPRRRLDLGGESRRASALGFAFGRESPGGDLREAACKKADGVEVNIYLQRSVPKTGFRQVSKEASKGGCFLSKKSLEPGPARGLKQRRGAGNEGRHRAAKKSWRRSKAIRTVWSRPKSGLHFLQRTREVRTFAAS